MDGENIDLYERLFYLGLRQGTLLTTPSFCIIEDKTKKLKIKFRDNTHLSFLTAPNSKKCHDPCKLVGN